MKRTLLGKVEVPGANYDVITAIVEIAPGFKAGRHNHPGTVQAQVLALLADLAAETGRLEREIQKLGEEIGKIDAKLCNRNFVARAPEEVVEEQRERRRQAEATRARLAAALKRLRA